jgi:CarboxypepD_reg-like domain
MQKVNLLILLLLIDAPLLFAQQPLSLNGKVTDAATGEPLTGASISIYTAGNVSGLVSNKDGRFAMNEIIRFDSLKFSMVGYHSKIFYQKELIGANYLEIKLTVAPSELKEIVIRPPVAIEIIKLAIAKINSYLPDDIFESRGFYREIIKDRENYFSVAEAVFKAQYFPKKEKYKLQLIRGRSKEDVSFTRLFEDFHPGGGPQSVAGNSFITSRPDFLNPKKINDFSYKIDSLVQFDGQWLYSISFDQKPGKKEALEKGTLLITKDDYAIVRYEAANSPLGSAYIKNLTGADKVFAEILNIDFKRKGWKRRVDFTKVNDKWIMSYAEAKHLIEYKQPKKNLDLDLTINIELLMTDLQLPVKKEISKEEEWKRKNMMTNLPGIFDSTYWGNNNIISPTETVNAIVAGISKNNNDVSIVSNTPDWNYVNRNFFVAKEHADSITLIPVMKCLWEDDETGGMLYKDIQGDFTAETRINISKTSNAEQQPDKGFQQAGIIIKDENDTIENYLLLSSGTGGNPTPKLFFKKTTNNKSKTVITKIVGMNGSLKMERKGNTITAYFKQEYENDWKKAGEYELTWLKNKVQLGFVIFAHFVGDRPKMKPDFQAIFSSIKIESK